MELAGAAVWLVLFFLFVTIALPWFIFKHGLFITGRNLSTSTKQELER
jgi:hypothetical protein